MTEQAPGPAKRRPGTWATGIGVDKQMDRLDELRHNINSPLTGVVGNLDLLMETELTSTQAEYVVQALISASSLMEVLSVVLGTSKAVMSRVSAPMSRVSAHASAAASAPVEAGAGPRLARFVTRETRTGLRILVAEDHPIHRSMLTNLLKQRGFDVVATASGREALDVFQPGRFNLALLDLAMPLVSGIEAATIIRQREEGTSTRVPIIAVSAHAGAEYLERCMDAGMDGYVTKPFRLQQLYETIDGVLFGAGPGREQSPGPC